MCELKAAEETTATPMSASAGKLEAAFLACRLRCGKLRCGRSRRRVFEDEEMYAVSGCKR